MGNIIIPGALALILEALYDEDGFNKENLLILWMFGFGGALASFFSNILLGIVFGILFFFLLVKRRGKKELMYVIAAVMPQAVMTLLYVIL